MRGKIVIKDVSKFYRESKGRDFCVLRDINLEIEAGEIFSIVGASGSGKSTLLNILAGFEPPSTGSVSIDGIEVSGPNPRYATVFQEYGLFPWMSVLENVEFSLRASKVYAESIEEEAIRYLRLVNLEPFLNYYPSELSGGMKQRIALARALAVRPQVLFMDEPFGALDSVTKMRLQDDILRIWSETSCTIVLVTHNIDEAVYLSSRVGIMDDKSRDIAEICSVGLPYPRNFIQSRKSAVGEHIIERLRA